MRVPVKPLKDGIYDLTIKTITPVEENKENIVYPVFCFSTLVDKEGHSVFVRLAGYQLDNIILAYGDETDIWIDKKLFNATIRQEVEGPDAGWPVLESFETDSKDRWLRKIEKEMENK